MNEEINKTVIERESSDLFCILICMMDTFLVSLSCKAVVYIVLELTVYAQEGSTVMDMRTDMIHLQCFRRG